MSALFPTGTVLGAVDQGFDVYVIPKDGPGLLTTHPAFSVVKGLPDVPLIVQSATESDSGTVQYTIGMPGYLLEQGAFELTGGWATITYDPSRLSRTFPNIDTGSSKTDFFPSGLVDTVWINAILEGDDGSFYARQFTLQGPHLYAIDGG